MSLLSGSFKMLTLLQDRWYKMLRALIDVLFFAQIANKKLLMKITLQTGFKLVTSENSDRNTIETIDKWVTIGGHGH